MAKNLNSVSFTVLLVFLVMASIGILKTEAFDCPGGCSLASERMYLGGCGTVPFLGTEIDCCNCCIAKYGKPPVCWSAIQGIDKRCNCYKHV